MDLPPTHLATTIFFPIDAANAPVNAAVEAASKSSRAATTFAASRWCLGCQCRQPQLVEAVDHRFGAARRDSSRLGGCFLGCNKSTAESSRVEQSTSSTNQIRCDLGCAACCYSASVEAACRRSTSCDIPEIAQKLHTIHHNSLDNKQ